MLQKSVDFSLQLLPGRYSPEEEGAVENPCGFRTDGEADEVEKPEKAPGIVDVDLQGISVGFPQLYKQRSRRLTGGPLRKGGQLLLAVDKAASAD